MNFVCIVFEIGDKMLTLSSMENLIVQCNLIRTTIKAWMSSNFGIILPLTTELAALERLKIKQQHIILLAL